MEEMPSGSLPPREAASLLQEISARVNKFEEAQKAQKETSKRRITELEAWEEQLEEVLDAAELSSDAAESSGESAYSPIVADPERDASHPLSALPEGGAGTPEQGVLLATARKVGHELDAIFQVLAELERDAEEKRKLSAHLQYIALIIQDELPPRSNSHMPVSMPRSQRKASGS